MAFGEKILKYREDILNDLKQLVAIESVASQSTDECKRALDFVLQRAQEMGLETENVDDIAGHVQYGSGGKLCGVLTHLDVVPAGSGWSSSAFELARRDGRLYGRGVADDKGAAIVSLYCLKALKDEGIVGKNTLRAIFGTREEVGMEDVKAYFSAQPMPDISFTPDCDYGICTSEKGIMQIEISAPDNDGTFLNEFRAGNAVNAVPDKAYVLLDCSESDEHQLYRFADAKTDVDFEFKYTIDGMMIIATGKASHACEPQKGVNAAAQLIDLLTSNFGYRGLGKLIGFLDSSVSTETNGNSLGIKMRDSASGSLTLCLSTVTVLENSANATIDIRYPVTMDSSAIFYRIRKAAEKEGLSVKILCHHKPLHLTDESQQITLLKGAYKAVMGEEPKLYSTGGGTYARELGGKGVAFGPVFPDDYSNMHERDESLNEEKFFLHAQICLQAMYDMLNLD
ncbi:MULTISPECIES: Sapep family Mn(2+)-dependent dipeptidase [unclassified Ruminococcus]|uniref:Sapep family Mn(2+)-dependent dipeptidase n=1 Tax=unclassified Ruminococcus TaxID=2608920 RepID=UPI00210D370F|nr:MULTISPECIES: Sapep family Mn(2+)-dependent dipeptidase [unclassified Ruminococcus]